MVNLLLIIPHHSEVRITCMHTSFENVNLNLQNGSSYGWWSRPYYWFYLRVVEYPQACILL